MYLNEIRAQISSIPVLHELKEDLRLRVCMVLLGIGHEVTATGGQVLFSEGEGDNDTAYVLLDGSVLIEKMETPEQLVQAPELLGEVVKFNPMGRRSATVTVQGEARLLKFLWTPFFHALESMFTHDEQLDVRHALEDLAWSHFAG